MRMNWQKQARVYRPEGEGQGGDAGQGDAGSGGEGQAAAGGAGGAADGAGDSGAKAQPSILDLAGKTDETQGEGKSGEEGKKDPPADAWKAPEGIADHLKGKDADETLAKVLKAYQGARNEIAKGGKMTGTIPETAEGYAIKAKDDKDRIAAEWSKPESKPFVDAFQAAALEMKLPAEVFSDLMRKGLEKVGDLGIPIGMTDEEAIEISAETEMKRLVELAGDPKAAATVVNTVETYSKKLVDSGLITEAERAEFRVMVGTAESAALFYKIMTAEFGERPIPLGDPGAGQISPQDAYAIHARAMAMKPGAERDQAMIDAQAAMQKAFGNQSAGSVKSNIL